VKRRMKDQRLTQTPYDYFIITERPHLTRVVIPSGARGLTIEVWITQTNQRDRDLRKILTAFRMTKRASAFVTSLTARSGCA
jgi:hypothetical protein